jgi:hypothetical protein
MKIDVRAWRSYASCVVASCPDIPRRPTAFFRYWRTQRIIASRCSQNNRHDHSKSDIAGLSRATDGFTGAENRLDELFARGGVLMKSVFDFIHQDKIMLSGNLVTC